MKRPRIEWKESREKYERVVLLKPSEHPFYSTSRRLSLSEETTEVSSSVIPQLVIATSAAISPSPSSSKDSTPIKTSRNALNSAMAGAMAAIFSRTIMAPIDRVKLMLQLQRVSSTTNSSTSSSCKPNDVHNSRNRWSAWNVCRQIYVTEGGLRAFWRGNSPNVIRQAGASALNFTFMDRYRAFISPIMNATLIFPSTRSNHIRKKRQTIVSAFLSGGLAGGTTTTFLYPFEFMRTRLALDVGPSRMYPRGMIDVFFKIWRTDGIRGMYQGYGIALTGVVLYRALHLGGYDACKTELLYRRGNESAFKRNKDCDKKSKITLGEQFAIAQIVSIVAGTLCYPIDSVRRRLMMQAGQPANTRQYVNSVDAFQKILTTEGVKGFYLGLGPNIVRSIAGALLLVSYDIFREGLET